MFAAVIALKAYSVLGWLISSAHSIDGPLEGRRKSSESHTDLIQPTLVGEDGDVSVISGGST
jgi:hypothetical protein